MRTAFEIVQNVTRMICSEWIAVNAYIERDVNGIESRLENVNFRVENLMDSNSKLQTLESFLQQLFVLRRQIRKYDALVSDQLQSKLHTFIPPSYYTALKDTVTNIDKTDLEQVQELLRRNNIRIKDTIGRVISTMSMLRRKKQKA